MAVPCQLRGDIGKPNFAQGGHDLIFQFIEGDGGGRIAVLKIADRRQRHILREPPVRVASHQRCLADAASQPASLVSAQFMRTNTEQGQL